MKRHVRYARTQRDSVSSFRVPQYVRTRGKVVFVGKEMPRVCSNSCVALCSDVEYFEHF
mgnify:CR=1 FL=1